MSLRRNGLFSAAEVIVNALSLFLIYRNVVQVLGVSMLGVWALVLASSAFGRAADLGISGSLSRYVASALAEKRPDRALGYMRTGITFMVFTMGAVSLALSLPLWYWLSLALNGAELEAARAVLPWAILNFWFLVTKTAIDSCLVGVHRADLRSVAGIAGTVLQLVLSLLLVHNYRLFGLAWAQTAQFVVALALEVVFLVTIARVRSPLTVPWFSWPTLKEMLGFGVKLQFGSMANLMFEPAVKTVIAAMAGTQVLGIFEMAYRMVYQVRNVATMALQPTIAAFASLTGKDGAQSLVLFRNVSKTAALAAATLMAGVVLGSPLISWLYLQRVDPLFVYTSGVMALVWGSTVLAVPAYYYGIASGRVWPYVIGECVAVVASCVAVFLLGLTGLAVAVVAGAGIGKLLGSLILGVQTRPMKELSSSIIMYRSTWTSSAVLAVACGAAIAFSLPHA
ncbi:oligosaccharide flippase family protein [Sinomonas soli]